MPLQPADLTEAAQASELQVERILRSETFRNAEALRRLFRFLADRLASGDADQLKEYSVGVDALGKPPDYDPRQDSTVRIQVGRLRLKLAEYYMSEGLQDSHIVELPKGHFKLKITPRQPVALAPAPVVAPPPPPAVNRGLTYGLGAVALLAIVWASMATLQLVRERQATAVLRAAWTPALEQLWTPFLASPRPVLVAIGDPPFVQFTGHGLYRAMYLNSWEDIEKSDTVKKIRSLLGNPEMTPAHYFAPIGEASAAFLLGKFLGARVPAISLSAARDLSWQQLASNNVIYVGAEPFFNNRFSALPLALDLKIGATGVTNSRPGQGELALYPENATINVASSGELYAVVTHVPGPSGVGEVTSFTGMRTPSRLGAVQWFIDAARAGELVSKMKNASGQLPKYYQVLLKVKFKDNVPTEMHYVLHHELTK